jgi:hypothetical protein
MNTLSWQPKDLAMLERFYSADQLWTWDNINEGSGAAGKVLEWLEKCPIPRRHPLVLPVRRKADPNPGWLCIAFSEMQCEELRENLNAFVGTAGCDFEGLRSTLPPSDNIASIAREWAGGNRIFDFRSLAAIHQKGLRERLERMLRVWALRPTTDTGSLRTTEAMLREFEVSLVNGNEQSAISWWEEIRAGGRLNAENLLFLKIQIPAAFGRWDDVDLDPNITHLAAARRPRRTTAILIEATWHTALKRKVEEGDVDGALAVMRERIQGPLRGLFRSPAGLSRPYLLLTFLIAAAADAPQRHAVVQALMDRLPEGSGERGFAEKIVAAVTPAPLPVTTFPVDALAQAWEARKRDDFHGAWLLLVPLTNSVERCRLLLECAVEHWDDDTVPVITAAMTDLSEEERAEVLTPKKLQIWEKISAPATQSTPAPADWESWFHEVERTPAWNQAISFARDASSLWPAEIYLATPSKVSNLAGLLTQGRDANASQIVRLSLPHIAGYFLADGPQTAFRVLYLDLLLSLALDDHFGGEDWGLAETLAFALVATGPSRADYEHLLSSLTTIWEERGDPHRFDWVLDQLDTFVTSPKLDEASLNSFFVSILNSCVRFARRLNADQRRHFALLCDDLGRSEDFEGIPWPIEEDTGCPEETSSEQIIAEKLSDRTVGIYSLNESASIRAGKLIEGLAENVKVRLSHDYGGSDKLKVIARDSDFLIVVTQCAKHAATDFIKAQRPKESSDLIYPSGRGAASIISALKQTIQKLDSKN